MAILFRPFGCLVPKAFNYLALQILDFEYTDEGYYGKAHADILIRTTLKKYNSCYYELGNNYHVVLLFFIVVVGGGVLEYFWLNFLPNSLCLSYF